MRQIGTLTSESEARIFTAHLLGEEISSSFENEDGVFEIWIEDEDALPVAKRELEDFQSDPRAAKYAGAEERASKVLAQRQAKVAQAKKNIVKMGGQWKNSVPGARSPRQIQFTVALIVVCGFVGFWTVLGDRADRSDPFRFVSFPQGPSWDIKSSQDKLIDISKGQVWRLVTPIFLHLSFIHLIFNMAWLYSLGGQIESIKGKWKYALMILVMAIGSNLVQGVFDYPFFGGMSGVVYGLFGFVLVKSQLDPGEGFFISQFNIAIMLIWFVVCFAGIVGNVANFAHAGGLVIGLLMGYVSSQLGNAKRR